MKTSELNNEKRYAALLTALGTLHELGRERENTWQSFTGPVVSPKTLLIMMCIFVRRATSITSYSKKQ